MTRWIFIFIIFVIAKTTFSQITITPGGTPTSIIQNLVGNGIQVSNVSINCGPTSYGTFTGNLGAGGTSLSNGGIILTTGSATSADGPNNIGSSGTIVPGFDFADPQLTTQPGAGNPAPALDNCVLQFDMVPSCGALSIAFVFGSEEYPEFVTGSFNDGFGIFVSGPNPAGGTYNNFNMARLPNGQLVSIDNVNINTNSAFYNTNTTGIMQYDGYTDGLLATVNTVPCATYSVKIIIADAGDESYDSGLFLGFQSFQCATPPFTVTPNITDASCGPNGAASVSITGGVGPFIYSWTGVTGQPTNTNAISNVAGGTYSLTVTDQGQCNATSTTQIVINNTQPIVTAVATSSTLCAGTSTTITAANGANYTWSPATGLNTTSGAIVTANPSTTTTYTVTSNTNGCIQTVNVPITVNPVPTLTVNNATICEGTSATLTATPSIAGGSTITWTPGNITGSTITVSPTLTTTYTPQYTLNGCSSVPASATVTVNPIPVVTVNNDVICEGESAQLNASANFSGGTYAWSTGESMASITPSPAASVNYTVNYTLNNCTSSTANAAVTVNTYPNATLSYNAPLCEGTTLNLNATNIPGANYAWTGPLAFNATQANPSVSNTPLGADGLYTLDVTINNCTSTFTLDVQVDALTPSLIDAAGPFCQSIAPVDLNAALEPGIWSGVGIADVITGSFDPLISGVGNHTITFDSDAYCTSPSTINVEVFDQYDATITPINPLCNNADPVTLSVVDAIGAWSGTGVNNSGVVIPENLSPGTYTATYTISGLCGNTSSISFEIIEVPDGTITPAGPFCQEDLPQTFSAATPGGTWGGTGITNSSLGVFGNINTPENIYTISYTLDGQCGGTWTEDIVVFENVNASISGPNSFCADAPSYQLTAANPGGVWSGNAPISNTGIIFPTALSPGTYTFSYDINNNGCLTNDDITIQVHPLPQVSFTSNLYQGCVPLAVTFTNTSDTPSSNCVWSVDGNNVGSGCNSFSYTFEGVDCFDVRLTSTDGNGCVNSFDIDDLVCTIPPPTADFTWYPTIPSAEDPEVFFTNLSFGNLSNTWTVNGQSFSDQNPSYIVPIDVDETFEACLSVVGQLGCTSQQCYNIVVDREEFVFIPNSFTPDNDGINDIFIPVISGLDEKNPDYHLKIFNRWGEIVFESRDFTEPWTGDVRAGDYYAPDGIYFWTMKVKLRERELTREYEGHLYLLR